MTSALYFAYFRALAAAFCEACFFFRAPDLRTIFALLGARWERMLVLANLFVVVRVSVVVVTSRYARAGRIFAAKKVVVFVCDFRPKNFTKIGHLHSQRLHHALHRCVLRGLRGACGQFASSIVFYFHLHPNLER